MRASTVTPFQVPAHGRTGVRFYAELCLIGFITYILHEAAHFLAGTLLGAQMQPSLNGVRYLTPLRAGQRAFVDIAGPMVTVLQAALAYVAVKHGGSLRAFGFLYMAAFMRAVAGLVSFKMLNDEARVSLFLHLPVWLLPVAVAGALMALVALASRRLRLGWKTQLLCYLVASVTTSLIVGSDFLYTRR